MRAACLSDWRGGWVDEGAPAPYAATAAAVRKEIIPTQADMACHDALRGLRQKETMKHAGHSDMPAAQRNLASTVGAQCGDLRKVGKEANDI